MNWQQKTLDTYNDSAQALAQYFKDIGPRVKDIEIALKLAGVSKEARVVEIGCGDARDALEIAKRVKWYQGFDPSKGLLDIATKKLPEASFVLADALSYDYPKQLDVIFAFASLLHVNRKDLSLVFDKASKALRPGGIFYISLKERAIYTEEIKKDIYGKRMFYYYNPALIKSIAGDKYESVFEDNQKIGKTDWFTIAFKLT